jgi:colanic acid/amylovoran biosynthesis protein
LSTSENNRIRIGLLWHSQQSDNLGVVALTEAHIALLDELALQRKWKFEYGIIGVGKPLAVDSAIAGLPTHVVRWKHYLLPIKLGKLLRSYDVIIDICGGDSFSDIYGLKRHVFLSLGKLFTLAVRRPLVFAPQTIGPFKGRFATWVAKRLIKRSALVVTRDLESKKEAQRLGAKDIIATSDVAFVLPYAKANYSPGVTHVGVNFSGLLYNGGYSGKNMFGLKGEYRTLVRSILAELAIKKDVQVHLVSHVISDNSAVEDDYRLAIELHQEFPSTILAPKFKSPSEAKSYISGLDFFAGSRMHACIAAVSSGVPCLPIAYSKKFQTLFATVGYNYTSDCTKEDNNTILSKLLNCLETLPELQAAVSECRGRAILLLGNYQDALAALINNTISRKQ